MEEEGKELRNGLGTTGKWISAVVVHVIIGVIFGLIRYFNAYSGTEKKALEFLADVFSITGLIGVLIWLLMLVSAYGAFSMIVYGTKKMFFAIFKRNPRSGLPRTYTEYVETKRAKGVNYNFIFLIVSGIVLVVGIVLLVIHYSI